MSEGQIKSAHLRCALDAAKNEDFTQRPFADLINEAHAKGNDYYVTRVHCLENEGSKDEIPLYSYYCYDAKHLCRYVFEMVISPQGRKIRTKNFNDPISKKVISEISFFRLRYDTETPFRAEYVGNHETFLESSVFRNKMFFHEDALESLSVNFQLAPTGKMPFIEKKRFLDIFLLSIILLLVGMAAYIGINEGKDHFKKIPDHIKNKV
ncbi:hypothetical protein ENBRE01_1129 [Enteropsectra breve]|nr:hypothetical protein ENBRE01_1129 [Enteropsectra breve]